MGRIFTALLLLSSCLLWAADKFQPLNVKTGLWETTSSITTSGELPIPAEFLSKLTPEQRARIDARMKANAAEKTKTHTSRSCLTPEKLQESPFSDEQKDCTRSLLASPSSKAEIRFECRMHGRKMDGTINLEALNSETVKGSGHTKASGAGHTMNTSTTFTSKWLGPNCGNIK